MNYFNIPDADNLFCSIWRFRPQHSALKIRVQDQNLQTRFWLYFIVPIFFKGPMSWKGANFRIANPNESAEFLASGFSYPENLKDYLMFVADVDNDLPDAKVIQILSVSGKLKEAQASI